MPSKLVTIPLFETYNNLLGRIPHIQLASWPTPIHKLNTQNIQIKTENNLWIKRDDLSHTEYGGNKVRKLEFILAEAKSLNKKAIITFGATGTNHGVATSLFCQKQNLDCQIFLFQQPVTETVRNNLKLMQVFNATLKYKGSLFLTALSFYFAKYLNKFKLGSKDNYYLFAGGSNVAGCIAFVNAAFELKQQIEQGIMPEPNFIYCPVGSSATLAGLTLGCHLAGLNSQVMGIRVAPSHLGIIPSCTTKTITDLMKRTYRHLRQLDDQIPKITLPEIHLNSKFYGKGYGTPSKEGSEASALFSTKGIHLEPTYTAKTAAAVLAHCNREPQQTILYWHTYNSANMQSQLQNADITKLSAPLQKIF